MMGVPGISSFADFANYVLALGFRGDLFYFRTVAELAARMGVWLNIVRLQFGPVLLLAALLAIFPLGRRKWRVLLLVMGTLAVNTLSAITYRAPQTVEYLIPSYVALALLLGHGLGLALRFRLPRSLGAIVAALLSSSSFAASSSFCRTRTSSSVMSLYLLSRLKSESSTYIIPQRLLPGTLQLSLSLRLWLSVR